MLNILWGAMMLIGITYGAMTGRMGEITDAALSSAKEAVVLCITMAGIVAMWMGVMEIARSSGMIEKMTEKMQPLLRFLFPNLPRDHPAMEYISANIIANFLGLGWGATPFGLKAMEKLAELEEERRQENGQEADMKSREMRYCTGYVRLTSIDVQLRTSEHRSMYSYVRLTSR